MSWEKLENPMRARVLGSGQTKTVFVEKLLAKLKRF